MENKNHISTIIKSLNSNYSKAKINGVLNNFDVAYLEALFKISNQCVNKLSHEDHVKFINEYTKTLNQSNSICKSNFVLKFLNNKTSKFEQAETEDCNQSIVSSSKLIHYWQEIDPQKTVLNIQSEITSALFLTKQSDSYFNFEQGKIINNQSIGRVIFVDSNSNTINYEIKDILGNEISNLFSISNNAVENYTTIISNNIYSFGQIFIKIKKSNASNPNNLLTRKHNNKFNLKFN
jgi:hypothetical protein